MVSFWSTKLQSLAVNVDVSILRLPCFCLSCICFFVCLHGFKDQAVKKVRNDKKTATGNIETGKAVAL